MTIARRQFMSLAAAALTAPVAARMARAEGASPARRSCDVTSGPGDLPTATSLSGVPLIERRKLFGNPSRSQASISPDGRWLSWLAPKDHVMNIWIAPIEDLEAARWITDDRHRGIPFYFWAHDGEHLLFARDKDGDENWHLHAVRTATAEARDLTPLADINAQLVGLSEDRPGTLVIGLNDRDRRWHDLYEVDIADGERRLILRNEDQLQAFTLDRRLAVRLAARSLPGGGATLLRREGSGFAEILRVSHEDNAGTQVVGLNRAGDAFYLLSGVGRDRFALFKVDWDSGRQQLLAEHGSADIAQVLVDPRTDEVEATSVDYLGREWSALPGADSVRADLGFLAQRLGSQFGIVSQTADNQKWIVVVNEPRRPGVYYLLERPQQTLCELFSVRPELSTAPLQPMHPRIVRARDGLPLVSFLTVAPGAAESGQMRPRTPQPMVLNVHGGPWSRDIYGFDPDHQWLANRGYAVLSVNFRGSTGFGKSFTNAGDREWGRRMHDDLVDAVAWAVGEGIADPKRIAIMGTSYGGYATLAALAFTPDLFCCGVDAVGPSNLETLLANIPPYWEGGFESLARRVGDPRTEEGRALLRERSPLHRAAAIRKPLLIGQGANDPRVKQLESDQIVAAMKSNGLPVTYVVYPDEGHGFMRPENALSWSAVVEAFLAAHLGGRVEPVGRDFEGARLQVPEGAAHVPGLAEGLASSSTK